MNDHHWARWLRWLAVLIFVLGWTAVLYVAFGADEVRDGLTSAIALGMSVSLAAAGIFGVGAYVGRSHLHDL